MTAASKGRGDRVLYHKMLQRYLGTATFENQGGFSCPEKARLVCLSFIYIYIYFTMQRMIRYYTVFLDLPDSTNEYLEMSVHLTSFAICLGWGCFLISLKLVTEKYLKVQLSFSDGSFLNYWNSGHLQGQN